jgi:hypothetical protein
MRGENPRHHASGTRKGMMLYKMKYLVKVGGQNTGAKKSKDILQARRAGNGVKVRFTICVQNEALANLPGLAPMMPAPSTSIALSHDKKEGLPSTTHQVDTHACRRSTGHAEA